MLAGEGVGGGTQYGRLARNSGCSVLQALTGFCSRNKSRGCFLKLIYEVKRKEILGVDVWGKSPNYICVSLSQFSAEICEIKIYSALPW